MENNIEKQNKSINDSEYELVERKEVYSVNGTDEFMRRDCEKNLLRFSNPNFYEDAASLSKEEILSKYGDAPLPIAIIPIDDCVFKGIYNDVKDNRVYTGLGSFIDHWVNHHPEMESEDFQNMQEVFNNPLKRYFDKSKNAVIFEGEINGFKDVVIVKKAQNKLLYERSNYLVKQVPRRWIEISPVDGRPTISQSEKTEAGIAHNISALDDIQSKINISLEQNIVNSSQQTSQRKIEKDNTEEQVNNVEVNASADNKDKGLSEGIIPDLILQEGNMSQQENQHTPAHLLDIIGQKVEIDGDGKITRDGWNDLSKVVNMYSDKNIETARYFFVKDGKIIRHVAVSTGQPSATNIKSSEKFLFNLRKYAEDNDCQVVFMHNHPSGYIAPSGADIQLTNELENYFVDTEGKKRFLGHIISDHGNFGLYAPSEGKEWFAIINDRFENIRKINDVYRVQPSGYGIRISTDSDLILLKDKAKELDAGNMWNKNTWIPAFFATQNGIVMSHEYINVADFDSPKALKESIKSICRDNNSDFLYFLPNDREQFYMCERFAKSTGMVRDVYYDNGRGDFEMSQFAGGRVFNEINIDDIKVEDSNSYGADVINNIINEKNRDDGSTAMENDSRQKNINDNIGREKIMAENLSVDEKKEISSKDLVKKYHEEMKKMFNDFLREPETENIHVDDIRNQAMALTFNLFSDDEQIKIRQEILSDKQQYGRFYYFDFLNNDKSIEELQREANEHFVATEHQTVNEIKNESIRQEQPQVGKEDSMDTSVPIDVPQQPAQEVSEQVEQEQSSFKREIYVNQRSFDKLLNPTLKLEDAFAKWYDGAGDLKVIEGDAFALMSQEDQYIYRNLCEFEQEDYKFERERAKKFSGEELFDDFIRMLRKEVDRHNIRGNDYEFVDLFMNSINSYDKSQISNIYSHLDNLTGDKDNLLFMQQLVNDFVPDYSKKASSVLSRAYYSPRVNVDMSKVLVLDLETTGVKPGSDEILQVSIINGKGETLLSSYVRPEHHDSWKEAEKINGISPETVKDAPTISELRSEIQKLLNGADMFVSYNGEFDFNFLKQAGLDIHQEKPSLDVMKAYAPIHGEPRQGKRSTDGYKWQKLSTAAEHYNIDFKAHDALGDTVATLGVAKNIFGENFEKLHENDLSRYSVSFSDNDLGKEKKMSVNKSAVYAMGSDVYFKHPDILEDAEKNGSPKLKKLISEIKQLPDIKQADGKLRSSLYFNLGKFAQEKYPELYEQKVEQINAKSAKKKGKTEQAVDDAANMQSVPPSAFGNTEIASLQEQIKLLTEQMNKMQKTIENLQTENIRLRQENETFRQNIPSGDRSAMRENSPDTAPSQSPDSSRPPSGIHPGSFNRENAWEPGQMVPRFGRHDGEGNIEILSGCRFSKLIENPYDISQNKVLLEQKQADGSMKQIEISERMYINIITQNEELDRARVEYANNEWMYNMAHEKYHENLLLDQNLMRVNTPENFVHNFCVASRLFANNFEEAMEQASVLFDGMTRYDKKQLNKKIKEYGKDLFDELLHEEYLKCKKDQGFDENLPLFKSYEEANEIIRKVNMEKYCLKEGAVIGDTTVKVGDSIKMAFHTKGFSGKKFKTPVTDFKIVAVSTYLKPDQAVLYSDSAKCSYTIPLDDLVKHIKKVEREMNRETARKAEEQYDIYGIDAKKLTKKKKGKDFGMGM